MSPSDHSAQPSLFDAPEASESHDPAPVRSGPGVRSQHEPRVGRQAGDYVEEAHDPSSGESVDPFITVDVVDPVEHARLEAMVADLEGTGRYKVLRRFVERVDGPPPTERVGSLRKAVYLDVETTGLTSNDKIIELALLVFYYDQAGNVVYVSEAFDEFEDPGRRLPPDIVSLTGITDEMVRGARIADSRVATVMDGADLVIAHNAGFDRQFVEARFPFFSDFAWACSVNDIDWASGGHRSRKLENLALAKGYFYQAHRAIYDCHVAVGLLRMPISGSGRPALADLIARAGNETVRLWAEGSPFDSKDALKARYYRWNGQAKVWWRDVPADLHGEELEWLAANVYPKRRPLPFFRITARTRYSGRLPEAPPPDAERM